MATGIWRGELVRRFAFANSARYLVPPVMVLGVGLGLVAGILGLIGLATHTGLAWALLGFVVPFVYVVFDVVAALVFAVSEDGRTRWWFLVVLPCIHFGWGLGFIAGFLALTKNITAHVGR